jgi:hypothetical protein
MSVLTPTSHPLATTAGSTDERSEPQSEGMHWKGGRGVRYGTRWWSLPFAFPLSTFPSEAHMSHFNDALSALAALDVPGVADNFGINRTRPSPTVPNSPR